MWKIIISSEGIKIDYVFTIKGEENMVILRGGVESI